MLLFGASIGPEAALVAIIGGLVTYMADRRKLSADQRTDMIEFSIGTSMGVIFMTPLFGVGRSVERDNWQVVTESKLKKYVLYIFTTFTGFIGYLLAESTDQKSTAFGYFSGSTSRIIGNDLSILFIFRRA